MPLLDIDNLVVMLVHRKMNTSSVLEILDEMEVDVTLLVTLQALKPKETKKYTLKFLCHFPEN